MLPLIYLFIPNKAIEIHKDSATCPEGKELALPLSLNNLFKNFEIPLNFK